MNKTLKFKIFDLIACFAMIVSLCVFPISANAEENTNGETINIANADQLAEAIAKQGDNQTWILNAGEYVLGEDQLKKYADWKGETGQGNWYFPIHANNITIIGNGDVTITSDVESTNGSWATQDFISVWGDNITIDNVDILSKKEQNKAIEVMGKNFKLANSEIKKVDEWGSGSIIFNVQGDGNIGTATLENVKLYSWISTNYSKNGTLNATNVTIDFTQNSYAGYKDEQYGYGWCPGIFNKNNNVVVNNTNLNIIIDEDINLTEQIFNDKLQSNTTVTLATDVKLDSMLDIANENVTLDLNGHTITASDSFTGSYDNDKHLVNVTGSNVTIKNGTLKTTDANKHALNIYEAENVVVEDVTLNHTDAFTGAPLVVNSSDVVLKGEVTFVTGDKSWYAVNVDAAEGKKSVLNTSAATIVYTGDASKGYMYTENADRVTIESSDDQGYDVLDDGTIGKVAATIGDKRYGSVQNAVKVANNGDTVVVKAGRHDEEVIVSNKAIKLVGEDGAELFNVTVVNTGDELDGLEIKNIDFYGASNKVSLDNNASTIYIQGKFKNTVIESNKFVLDDSYANKTTVAITTGAGINGLIVKDNVIDGYTMSAYHNPDWSNTSAKGSNDITYTGNEIKNVLSGIYFGAVDGVTVTRNTFTQANGVRFQYDSTIDVLKENKFISRPDDTQYGSYAVRFYEDGVEGTVDLSYNYWGTQERETINKLIDNENSTYTLETYYVTEDMNELNTDVNIFEFDGLTLELKVGDKAKVNVTAKDYDGNVLPLTWSSENEKVATVEDGVITAVGEGSTKIIVSANGKSISIDVVVKSDSSVIDPTTPDDGNDTEDATTNDKGDTPQTSDNTNFTVYGALVMMSLVGMGIVVTNKKRKELK